MKTIFSFMIALLFATNAGASPNQYPARSFGDATVNLQPLFAWWTFASQTTNTAQDITEMNSTKLETVSNIWAHLPVRPLPNWLRITGTEEGITITGNMWRVDATIEAAPMMYKRETILLRHPPVKEIQDFKQARAQYAALQDTPADPPITTQAQAVAPTNNVLFPGTTTTRNGVVVARTGAAAVGQEIATAAAISNNVQASTMTNLADLEKYLASFPSTNVYSLDHFALRTGEVIEGRAVYDLGGAVGLNY